MARKAAAKSSRSYPRKPLVSPKVQDTANTPPAQAAYFNYPPNYRQGPNLLQGALVLLLIVMAFFSGYLFFKVQNLEKGAVAGVGQPAGADEQAPPPMNLKTLPKVTDADHIRGSKDAQIVLVEYSDLECPFCKDFHATLLKITAEYGDQVAWVYRHYPLSFHQNAQKEAEASECVAELGGNDAFWSFIDKVFERTTANGTGFALDKLAPLAAEIGVDAGTFQACLDSGKYTKKVQTQLADGTKVGVSGTPGTIIVAKNGKKDFIAGAYPYEQVKAQIDALLK